MAGMLFGRVLLGRFVSAEPFVTKDGRTVSNMYRLVLDVSDAGDGSRLNDRMSYFGTDFEDDPTPIARSLESQSPRPGDLVAVRFRTTVQQSKRDNRYYPNDEPMQMAVLSRARNAQDAKAATAK